MKSEKTMVICFYRAKKLTTDYSKTTECQTLDHYSNCSLNNSSRIGYRLADYILFIIAWYYVQ